VGDHDDNGRKYRILTGCPPTPLITHPQHTILSEATRLRRSEASASPRREDLPEADGDASLSPRRRWRSGSLRMMQRVCSSGRWYQRHAKNTPQS